MVSLVILWHAPRETGQHLDVHFCYEPRLNEKPYSGTCSFLTASREKRVSYREKRDASREKRDASREKRVSSREKRDASREKRDASRETMVTYIWAVLYLQYRGLGLLSVSLKVKYSFNKFQNVKQLVLLLLFRIIICIILKKVFIQFLSF